MVQKFAIIGVLVTIFSFISARPALESGFAEVAHGASTSGASIVSHDAHPASWSEEDFKILMHTPNDDETTPLLQKKPPETSPPKGPTPQEKLADIDDSLLSIRQRRIKYGQSYSVGGKVSGWAWRNLIKPIFVPFKRLYKFLTAPVFKGTPKFTEATREEMAALAQAAGSDGKKEGFNPQFLQQVAEKHKLTDREKPYSFWDPSTWMNRGKAKPQDDSPRGNPGKQPLRTPSDTSSDHEDDIPIAYPAPAPHNPGMASTSGTAHNHRL